MIQSETTLSIILFIIILIISFIFVGKIILFEYKIRKFKTWFNNNYIPLRIISCYQNILDSFSINIVFSDSRYNQHINLYYDLKLNLKGKPKNLNDFNKRLINEITFLW